MDDLKKELAQFFSLLGYNLPDIRISEADGTVSFQGVAERVEVVCAHPTVVIQGYYFCENCRRKLTHEEFEQRPNRSENENEA